MSKFKYDWQPGDKFLWHGAKCIVMPPHSNIVLPSDKFCFYNIDENYINSFSSGWAKNMAPRGKKTKGRYNKAKVKWGMETGDHRDHSYTLSFGRMITTVPLRKATTQEIEQYKAERTVWDLQEGEDCYMLFASGYIIEKIWMCTTSDSDRRAQGNVFLNKEEAEAERDRRAEAAAASKPA